MYITRKKLFTVDEHLWAPQVVATFKAMGFQEFLQLRRTTEHHDAQSVKILKLCSGEVAAGEGVGKLQEALAALLPDDDKDKLLYIEPYAGMFEAILNSHTWAYPDTEAWAVPQPKRWWITGAVDLLKRQVTVIAYDQGVSIPAMLPGWKHYGRLQRLMLKVAKLMRLQPSDDGLSLRLAMKISQTSTGLPQHGKGLHTMVEVAQRASWGRLRLLSRQGEYKWETGSKPTYRSFPHPLRGTLVEWQLQL